MCLFFVYSDSKSAAKVQIIIYFRARAQEMWAVFLIF